MIRTAALITAFAFFTAQSARQGDTLLAANAVLNNLVMIAAYFLDGFAMAAEQLCGRAVGARDERAFRRATKLCDRLGLRAGADRRGVFWLGGATLIGWMTASPEVRADGRALSDFRDPGADRRRLRLCV